MTKVSCAICGESFDIDDGIYQYHLSLGRKMKGRRKQLPNFYCPIHEEMGFNRELAEENYHA